MNLTPKDFMQLYYFAALYYSKQIHWFYELWRILFPVLIFELLWNIKEIFNFPKIFWNSFVQLMYLA